MPAPDNFDYGLFDPLPQAQQEASLLDQPGARAALLQFGLNASQPRVRGQTELGHLGAAVGSGAEAFNRGAALDEADRQAAIKNDQSQQKIDAVRDRLTFAQRFARGGPSGQTQPQQQADDGMHVPAGTSQASPQVLANAGPPAAAGPKPPVSEFVSRHPDAWATLKQRAQNGSPAERQSAAEAIARLKGLVADPQTVDQLLAS